MAQSKEDLNVGLDDKDSDQKQVVYPVLSADSSNVDEDGLSGVDLMIGIGFTNFYALPVYIGVSYQFADFYHMMVDIKLAALAQFMISADWMHMFELFGNEYIALSAGAGIGYLSMDKITIRFDGSYEEDDEAFKGKRGMVFPAAVAFDWHTGKDVSLRILADFNNYLVLEDKRDKSCKVPRYEFHYDIILQAVIHL